MLVLGLQAILADECFHRLFATFCLHGYYRCLYKMSLGEDKGKKIILYLSCRWSYVQVSVL